jgi:hypothetical protein
MYWGFDSGFNATPAMVLTRVWPRTNRARTGMRLGVGMRRRGPRKADDGEARHDGDGEQSGMREGGEKGEKRPARFLTPRQSSGSCSWQQKSVKAAAAMATEMQR